ncbi:hypothetical protein P4S68_09285 [Pseudoalteromonas sp. Hal099]
MHKIEQNLSDYLIDSAAMQIAQAQRTLNSNKQVISSLEEQYMPMTDGQLAFKQNTPKIPLLINSIVIKACTT